MFSIGAQSLTTCGACDTTSGVLCSFRRKIVYRDGMAVHGRSRARSIEVSFGLRCF